MTWPGSLPEEDGPRQPRTPARPRRRALLPGACRRPHGDLGAARTRAEPAQGAEGAERRG